MNIREQREQLESLMLSPYASFSAKTLGRDREEKLCDVRPEYQRDRDRILHSKAFRRMKHKTQVFLAPEGDHYRTRLTHTLEVSQIARTIARALRLNEDLTEAIALGHDLGHTAFGHAGEAALNEVCPLKFSHYEQSVRVVEFLEKNGKGLNLTKEVRDGILNHRTSGKPKTLEGAIVRLSDKIAYINHDIDDSIRAKMFKEEDLPEEFTSILGHSVRQRLDTLVHDVIISSANKPEISMSDTVYSTMMNLRKWMFKHVYLNETAKSEEGKAKDILKILYGYYMDNIGKLPVEYRYYIEELGEKKERVVCDYIAGMTDSYAVETFSEIFIPKQWKV
jgi:deoxyguanosinetriphosphate triphosphohydrolase-like protein